MKKTNAGLLLVWLAASTVSAPFIKQAVAAPPIAASNQTDERALAALDRAVDYYGRQPSFSLNGRETLSVDGEVVRHTTFEFQAQQFERASLRFTPLNSDDEMPGAVNARLLDADSYRVQTKGQPASSKAIRTARARQKAFADLTSGLPSLGLSLGAFLLKTNPLRTLYLVDAAYETGENNSEIVTARVKTADDPTIVTAKYKLDSATGALRSLETSPRMDNIEVTILTEFDALIPNGKGSQEATDAAVYNWDIVAAPDDETATGANVAPQTSVDPAARALFDRAARLYRGSSGLHLAWKQIETSEFGAESSTAALDYRRAGLLRLQYPGLLTALVVVGDANKWTLQSELMNPDGPPRYRQTEVAGEDRSSEALSSLMVALYLPRAVGELLSPANLHPLSPLVVAAASRTEGFVSLEASALQSQMWNGEFCDLVQILEVNRPAAATPPQQDINQSVYWFARSDGRLMRLQEGYRSGESAGSTTDSQITEQTFNPMFAPDTFSFAPPKGAVLADD